MKIAVVILFHGSKAEGSEKAAHRIVDAVRQRGKYSLVEAAFLQHARPCLMDTIQSLAQQQAGKIVIVPFFLQTGMHVTAEIPVLVKEAQKRHPKIPIAVTNAVGSHSLMADVVLDLAGQAEYVNAVTTADAD